MLLVIFDNIKNIFQPYKDKALLAFLLLGIASGIPLPLTAASVLSVMLHDKGLDLAIIGTFALSAVPYSIKYLWAPLLDAFGFKPLTKWLGKRNSWLPVTQILLVIAIVALGYLEVGNLFILRLTALTVAALSATQDILIDSLRIRSLPQEKQGAGAAAAVLGYRIGMIIASAGSFYISGSSGSWSLSYLIIGSLVLLAIPLALIMARKNQLLEERDLDNIKPKPYHKRKFLEIFINPWRSFIQAHIRWYFILLALIFYKLSDAYLGSMTNIFLLELGFNKVELASIIKLYGTIATFVGMFFGGYLIARINVIKGFYLGVLIQSISNLAFIIQYYTGYNLWVLMIINSIENFCGGISSSILVAFISSLCQRDFTASQYAIFAALASIGRTIISSSAGVVVTQIGWYYFFILSSLLSLPSMLCLYCAEKKYKAK